MDNLTHDNYQSKYLDDEHPILIRVSIARALNSDRQAYFLQQVRYWINTNKKKPRNKHYYNDGRFWMYNTLDDWHKQFPWLSVRTIQRIINELKLRGILITGNYNKVKYDKTVWYSIDERKLDEVIDEHMSVWTKCPHGDGHNDHMDVDNMTEPIPETYPEGTAESGSALNFTDKEEQKNIVVKWKELYKNHYDIEPRVTKREGKLLNDTEKQYGYDDTITMLELYLKHPTPNEKENGNPLKWLPGAINRLLTKLKEHKERERIEAAQEAAEKRRQEKYRQEEEAARQEEARRESLTPQQRRLEDITRRLQHLKTMLDIWQDQADSGNQEAAEKVKGYQAELADLEKEQAELTTAKEA